MISSSNHTAPDRAIIPTLTLTSLVTFAVFAQSTTSVHVSNANAPAADHLVVGGYDVSGEVRSDGEPMKEVTFLLYSATVKREVNTTLVYISVRSGVLNSIMMSMDLFDVSCSA